MTNNSVFSSLPIFKSRFAFHFVPVDGGCAVTPWWDLLEGGKCWEGTGGKRGGERAVSC